MAVKKNRGSFKSVYDIGDQIRGGKFLPVYYFFGEDDYTINNAVRLLETEFGKKIFSDLDKETFNEAQKAQTVDIIDSAYAYPFGGGEKLILIKDFKSYSDIEQLKGYAENPSEFTRLIIIEGGDVSSFAKEPYATLARLGYAFEASQLKRPQLKLWAQRQANKLHMVLGDESSELLLDLVGEDKSLLGMQLEKISDFLGEGQEISPEIIEKLSSKTKTYNLFDLQNALIRADKSLAYSLGMKLLSQGVDISLILGSIAKFISTMAKITELKGLPDYDAAKKAEVAHYYYLKCKESRYFSKFKNMLRSSQALINADIKLKTTQAKKEIIFAELLSEFFPPEKNSGN